LYQALGWEPPVFVHVTNILGTDRRKLSKRESAAEFLNYKAEGYLPEALFNFMALLGWSSGEDRDLYTRQELVEAFDLNGLVGHPAILDKEKLLWFNGKYIRDLSKSELARRTLPFIVRAGLMASEPDAEQLEYLGDVLALEQERMKTLADAPALSDFFLLADKEFAYEEKAVQKWLSSPGAAERLTRVREELNALTVFEISEIECVVAHTAAELGLKNAEVIHPVRVAVTGRTVGPGLYETLAVLGRDRVDRRLARALARIGA
jgi:glutamyl/glutaminyl-tRNA synthetase